MTQMTTPWERPGRFWRHLSTDHGSARRAFPEAALDRLKTTIAAGEQRHSGQVCLAIEASLPPTLVLHRLTPRDRALEVFGRLRVWDTEENSGVLVYLLLADRDVEIVADRGIHRKVGDDAWQAICRTMEAEFQQNRFEQGTMAGIEAINTLLARHFPRTSPGTNEIPDRPVIL
jgi:uncharacterized membrane protein YgcG